MSTQAGQTLEDILSIPFACAIHGVNVKIGLYDQQWEDGSYLFYGYSSQDEPAIAIAGQTVRLQIEIIPQGAPKRTNPFLSSIAKGQNTVAWYENAPATLADADAFLKEFEEKRGFLFNGALNSEIRKHYNHKDLHTQLDAFSAVMQNTGLTFPQKVLSLAPILIAIRRILEANRIPDELKYEESLFYLNVLHIQKHVQSLIETTSRQTPDSILSEFLRIVQNLADTLEAIREDHQRIARSREPRPTEQERQAIFHLLDEHTGITALEKDSPQAMQHIGRDLELCREIWSTPTVDWQTRLNCATRAVDILLDAINRMEAAAIASKKRHATIPNLSRIIQEINARLDELDQGGLAAIIPIVATRFLGGINKAGKTAGQNQPFTKESLADAMRLNHLLITVTEKEGALSTSLHLYLACDEPPHTLPTTHVLIQNGKIHGMKLSRPS